MMGRSPNLCVVEQTLSRFNMMWKTKRNWKIIKKYISRMLGCLPEALSLTSSARHTDDSTWIKGKGGIKNHHIISNVIIVTQVQMIVFAI